MIDKNAIPDETTKEQAEVILKDNGYEAIVNPATQKQRRICNLKYVKNQLYIKKLTYNYETWDRMIKHVEKYAKDKGHDYLLGTLQMIDPDAFYIKRTMELLKRSGFTVNAENFDYYKLVK